MSFLSDTCLRCGGPLGAWGTCPRCYTIDEQERIAKENRRHEEKLHREVMAAAAAQTDAQLRESERMADLIQEQSEAAERIADEQREAWAQETEQRRRDLSEAWRLAADRKRERAETLIAAGLFQRAFDLLEDSLKQDPSNLATYVAMSEACKGLQERALWHQYTGELLKLAFASTPNQDPSFYRRVLNLVRGTDLESELCRYIRLCADILNCRRSYFELIKDLIALEHIEDAHILARTAARSHPSLIHHAICIAVHGPAKRGPGIGALRDYLSGIPAESRGTILSEWNRLSRAELMERDFSFNIPADVVEVVRSAVRDTYSGWDRAISDELRNKASSSVQWTSAPRNYGWLAFTLATGAGYLLGAGITLWTLLAAGVVGTGVRHAIRLSIRHQQFETSYASLYRAERDAWNCIELR